ncbi:DUF4232 domain-containing protein [Streptomyces sp. RKCA744]|uniref:DUF4232 domain-containing protein n=1 Tax=Streptomyces sp. RKCA744 TaxID=2959340 RepID=UPI00209F4BAF|nr:DUF4232 domain-containing protein [Streptomyces sp. RKCA744]MCO8303629.1 DUF4232 domain-containing protein [Streptomyces sp. RKCA744]
MSCKTAVRRSRTRTVAAASLIAAAALSLTACGSGDSGNDAKGSPSAAASTIAPGGSEDTSGGSGGSTRGSSVEVGAKVGIAADVSASAKRCTTRQLEASWASETGPDMNNDGQQTVLVMLKNTGSADCSMVGFPGVQLQTTHGETWDLRRDNEKPKPVTVSPGEQVAFDITFLASTRDDDRKFAPNQVVITPPNERGNLVLDWPYGGALLDQSAATHPGTFIGPVNAGM